MRNRKNGKRRRGGFTLIEVLLVLTILVIIASLAVMAYGPAQRSAQMKAAKTQIGAFMGPLERYRMDMGDYPRSLEELRAQPADGAGRWQGPYLGSNIPPDPWGQPYNYQPGSSDGSVLPHITSNGPDRIPNTQDDVASE